ncbi:hypothetical protein [Holdemanella biformis]|uniref:hypothetical protein n=1 Tax=Holdemanella biformis TaxID=1735 RepID=UPI00307A02F1
MILGIDPANEYSAFVVVENDLSAVVDKGKISNLELQDKISNWKAENYPIDYVAIEGIQSFGMPVGQTTFETCYFIGRLLQQFESLGIYPSLVYRSEEKMALCHSMKAKDSNIRQALVDRFAKDTPNKGKGTKKEPGFFYGFKSDIYSALAVACVFYEKMNESGCNHEI